VLVGQLVNPHALTQLLQTPQDLWNVMRDFGSNWMAEMLCAPSGFCGLMT